jgi:hypothetical protein
MADKDAGSYQILELMREAQQLRKAKNGREAVALGRQGGRLLPFPGVFAARKPQAENPQGWPTGMPALTNVGVDARSAATP